MTLSMLKTLAGVLICGSSGRRSTRYYENFANPTVREFTPTALVFAYFRICQKSVLASIPWTCMIVICTDYPLHF